MSEITKLSNFCMPQNCLDVVLIIHCALHPSFTTLSLSQPPCCAPFLSSLLKPMNITHEIDDIMSCQTFSTFIMFAAMKCMAKSNVSIAAIFLVSTNMPTYIPRPHRAHMFGGKIDTYHRLHCSKFFKPAPEQFPRRSYLTLLFQTCNWSKIKVLQLSIYIIYLVQYNTDL